MNGDPVWHFVFGRSDPDNQLFALSAADGKTQWDATGTVEQAGLLGTGSPAIARGPGGTASLVTEDRRR